MKSTERAGWPSALDSVRAVLGVTLSVGVGAVILILKLPRPFVWIFAAGLVLCLVNAVLAQTEWGRRFFLAGSGLALSLGALEGVSAALDRVGSGGIKLTGTYTQPGYFVEGGELGYAPAPGARVHARKTVGEHLVYDVTYTISPQGVRVTRGNPSGRTWLFMGCSLMFGEGLNDDQTLPALFSAELGYRDMVVNFGFHGYGPHQMLRALETDRPRSVINGLVAGVVYEGIWDHAWRAAGHDDWDLYGPSYALSTRGVTYVGPFHRSITGMVLKVLRRSDLFRFVADRTFNRSRLSDGDIERYARILERSAQLSREKYGAPLTVVYWDDDNAPSRRVLARLRQSTLQLMLVSDVIPRSQWRQLTIKGDGHPNADANRRLAAALAARFGVSPRF